MDQGMAHQGGGKMRICEHISRRVVQEDTEVPNEQALAFFKFRKWIADYECGVSWGIETLFIEIAQERIRYSWSSSSGMFSENDELSL